MQIHGQQMMPHRQLRLRRRSGGIAIFSTEQRVQRLPCRITHALIWHITLERVRLPFVMRQLPGDVQQVGGSSPLRVMQVEAWKHIVRREASSFGW